ncbi:MAG TPA: glycosyltransferase family 4 protein [Pyrinomonadaceae bacterium]
MSLPVNRRRKLIFLWTYANWGGAQVYFFAIMKLARKTWDVVVVLPRESKPELLGYLDELGVRREYLPIRFDPKVETTIRGKIKRQFERIRSEITAYRHLRKIDLRESVLHLEVAPWQSWQLLTMLSLRGANVFATLHNFRPDAPWWRRLVWKLRFQIASRLPGFHIFASNRDTKESLKNWVTPKFWETIEVTYTCVDPELIKSARVAGLDVRSERQKLGIPNDCFVVLAVGQFIDRKGRWIFLEAAQRLKSHTDIYFVWVMPDGISEEEQGRIEEYDLGNRFVPVISSSIGSERVEILRFFRLADAFALPSYVEGLPIALLEAMAMGIPSISSKVYAIPEAVIHEETGLLIDAGDADALANAIMRLKRDTGLREKLAVQGSEFVLTNFDERDAARQCIRAYENCFE